MNMETRHGILIFSETHQHRTSTASKGSFLSDTSFKGVFMVLVTNGAAVDNGTMRALGSEGSPSARVRILPTAHDCFHVDDQGVCNPSNYLWAQTRLSVTGKVC
ncbi:hypothetical protein E2C01_092012 [Portunus trituberculatus]|uniref:Uncharacterized protein n=1 Tax=Portunus trituberculatus TaxID=210409 RepID=A0A5B7JQX7_PORTR|nr:hypothetical protein [Portunus trituberculatus]